MSYTKTTWVDGDIISAEKLNKIENGIYAAQESVPDIQINGTSIVDDGVANIPYASLANAGVIKIEPNDGGYLGMGINSAGFTFLKPAESNEIKAGEMYTRRPIIPSTQHESVFYGLAKASGDTTQSQSSNAVGTYTDAAKGAIKSMLGVEDPEVTDVQVNGTSVVTNGVANIPIVTSNGSVQLGLVKPMVGLGTAVATNGGLAVVKASDAQIKTGTNEYAPIVPQKQHASVFYGLAKLAGVDMKNSSNSVGEYTEEAKIAIQKMLGIYQAPWELIRNDTGTNDTEADVTIDVDGNGESFELTDVRILFWLPTQSTAASKGDYGRIYAYYDSSNADVVYCGAWTQASGATGKICGAEILQDGGMIHTSMYKNVVLTAEAADMSTLRAYSNPGQNSQIWTLPASKRLYSRIKITNVTGSYGYIIYGKRNWS